jgi:hypothetical protein
VIPAEVLIKDNSRVWLVVRKSLAGNSINTEAGEAMVLDTVTKQRLLKTQQTEKT